MKKLVCVLCLSDNKSLSAKSLAEKINVPLFFSLEEIDERYHYAFLVEDKGLSLKLLGSVMTPVYVDFLAGSVGHRAQFGGGRRQLLSRAVGLHKYSERKVLDVSAGLGQDSFILAHLGASVIAVERSLIVATLLQDGLDRLFLQKPESGEKIKLFTASAVNFMQQLSEKDAPQIVYYDPMYPERGQSAKAKKEMRILRDIVGDDDDAEQVLMQALQTATERVVVKRPRLAAKINSIEPSWELRGERCRYDVYLV